MMNGKIPSEIKKITLNTATFNGVEVVPTLINFFYGNNGAGKSTIAQAIGKNNGLTWKQGKAADNYSVLVYNQEFVAVNFQNYGNLRGVFTIGEQNIEIQNQIGEMAGKKVELDKSLAECIVEKERKETAQSALLVTFQENCWNKTKAIRAEFDATQAGYKRKAQLAEKVLQIASPTQHNLAALRVLYDTAFDENARSYGDFKELGGVSRLKGSNASELLARPIVSSSDTPFSAFIKALNAADWVRQGRDRFTETAEKCPYCQQKLPADFEAEIAACFDAQYQQCIDGLKKFQSDYESDMRGFIDTLKSNLTDVFPKLDLTEYNDKLALFEKMIEINIQRIANKTKEPSAVVKLESVKTLREELNVIIAGFNGKIQENNAVVATKTQKRAECKTKVWELLAYTLQGEVSAYRTNMLNLNKDIITLTQKITAGSRASQTLEQEIADLNKKIVSTKPTIDGINNLLRDSGFQGFSLREKRGQQNVYEVVRSNGGVAENLSDGERSFIAFLYFYFLVRGSHSDSDAGKDKIVVIDDPVSSMDSNLLFIVSALVREMVEVCFNNADYLENRVQGDYIKQIFVLTHNVYFHREITYNQINRYKGVSFFVVNKTGNISTVRLCVRQNVTIPTGKENFNPVQNSYAALWSEYKEVDTAIPVLNVIRRVLEYYFMQLCGYEGVDIRKRVLEDNRGKFVDTTADGQPDYSKYNLASAMLSYINANSVGASDGLNYVDDCTDVSQYKEVFKLIFETLQQSQHYKMMMGEDG